MRRCLLLLALLLPLSLQAQPHTLMPVPHHYVLTADTEPLWVDADFQLALTGYTEPRLERAAVRFLKRLATQTGLPIQPTLSADTLTATLILHTQAGAAPVQQAVEDEAYRLTVTPFQARLDAPSPYGTLRGIETFLQLVAPGPDGFEVAALRIDDAPRFPWRGLLIDVCRHFLPMEVLKRNLDGMAAMKMNVMHWHLSEDQGFRIESKRFPRLHEMGSNGQYFTQDQVRELIEYAQDRGIRIVPEFDMPGHTTAWFVGHPELASQPGPYEIERTYGVMDPAMDPTKESTYEFLDAFIGEMAALFPDAYFHIGGDEVHPKHWNENPRIQAYIQENNLGDNHGLQAYFNRRLLGILTKYGKQMIGWDEIFHPDLPKNIVVQSWRGQQSLADGARQGYQGILSNGYYLDLVQPASAHYAVDPLSGPAADLTPDQQRLVLGGEACMWAELVTPENVDSRIWPRAAAIAERLWSPGTVTDVDDMYYRLDVNSRRLEWLGLTHRTSYPQMLQRLTHGHPIAPLRTLADLVEPVKFYQRHRHRKYFTTTPMNRLVDATRPESRAARHFGKLVDTYLADPANAPARATLRETLGRWHDNDTALQPLLAENHLLAEVAPLSRTLADVARRGLLALDALENNTALTAEAQQQHLDALTTAAEPQAEVLLMIVPAVQRLVEAVPMR